MSNTKDIVYVLDDDITFGKGVRELLSTAGLECKLFTSANAFLDQYSPSWIGCLLLDVRLPEVNGLDIQQRLVQQKTQLPIIVITAYADVPMTVRAMKQGAFHLLQKPFKEHELLEVVQDAIRTAASERAANRKRMKLIKRLKRLSPREREVLEHIVSGGMNKTIADELNISIKTVEYHRSRLMGKMGVHSATDLVRTIYLSFPKGKLPPAET